MACLQQALVEVAGQGAVAWRRAGQARAALNTWRCPSVRPQINTARARARVCSPLSVERHAEFTFDQVVGVGGAPGDTPHGVAAVCNVPASRPSSVLYSDSLKFDFDEVCAHFPSPPPPGTSPPTAAAAAAASSSSSKAGPWGDRKRRPARGRTPTSDRKRRPARRTHFSLGV